ncbi:2-dehydro-3-deoxy-6-phosphogalactonate aldolase [Thalassotalea sp. PLHSN55]|uniref:2-dehydro-3-deoxy-6-phosphogalactonate aldolase n=1 Tax=Thalassotalea sp. PLHSN55 TaxID=3435888 RepID=UPI003F8775B8
MTASFELSNHLPLIAILRGVKPDEVINVANILVAEGFTIIEVPLNSPDALTSIKLLVEEFGDRYLIGAGTVTTSVLAEQVIATGANLVVTPNLNEQVMKLAVDAGCATFPGVVTPSEAFKALELGATGLKLFPISMVGQEGFKALKSVLPPSALCFPVGGIEPSVDSMKPYVDIGAVGFGLGSALYKAGMSNEEIRNNAQAYVSSFKSC